MTTSSNEPQQATPNAAVSAADRPSEADAAADWEEPLAENSASVSSQKTLNQEEIDRLIGAEGANASARYDKGIKALLAATGVSYERLPLLEIVFARLAGLLTTSLRNFASDKVEANLESVSSIRFGDYMNAIPLPAILGIFRAEELDNYGLITVDSSLIYSMVDILLGGARGASAMRIEDRPYTTIERRLIQELIETILVELRKAFEPVSPINFVFDRIETDPRFATISRPANAAVLMKVRIEMGDRGGKIDLLLPYATLEPIRETLLQMFMGEKFGRDSIWEKHLASELWRTKVQVEAVLEAQSMPLKDVMNIEVGQTLLLEAGPESCVEVHCGGVKLLTGKMGRVGRNVAVSIDSSIKKPA